MAMSASFIVGKSPKRCAWKTVPLVLFSVAQLVTGQVRCHVTGRKPTMNLPRSVSLTPSAVEEALSM